MIKRVLYLADGERIDEVAGRGYYHLERMDQRTYWIGLEAPDGSPVHIWIEADAPIRVTGGADGEPGVWPDRVVVERHERDASPSPGERRSLEAAESELPERTSTGVIRLDDLQHHTCSESSEVFDATEGTESPSPRDWGGAVNHIVKAGGAWWAVAGTISPEYSTPIRFCPWCGVRLS